MQGKSQIYPLTFKSSFENIYNVWQFFCMSAALYSETSLCIKSQIFLFVVGMQIMSPMPSLNSCSVRRS